MVDRTSELDSLRRISVVVIGSGPAALALLLRVLHPGMCDLWTDDEQWLKGRRAIDSLIGTKHNETDLEPNQGETNTKYAQVESDVQSPKSDDSTGYESSNQNHPSPNFLRESILVIDPMMEWCNSWDRNFEALQIARLRSTVLAHPCPIDAQSLRAFAATRSTHSSNGSSKQIFPLLAAQDMAQVTQKANAKKQQKKRRKEARRQEQEATSVNGEPVFRTNQRDTSSFHAVTQTGTLWPRSSLYDLAVPSSELFREFCQQRVREYKLESIRIKAKVESIERVQLRQAAKSENKEDRKAISEDWYLLHLSTGERILAWSVVACVGNSVPRIPAWAQEVCKITPKPELPSSNDMPSATVVPPANRIMHSSQLIRTCFEMPNGIQRTRPVSITSQLPSIPSGGRSGRLLVVGGGLTSAQLIGLVAAASTGFTIEWAMRGYMRVKAFDVDLEWVSSQSANGCMARFHALDSLEEKVRMIRHARQGGSIPQETHEEIKRLITDGILTLREQTEVESIEWKTSDSPQATRPTSLVSGEWDVRFSSSTSSPISRNRLNKRFDAIWLGTGSLPDVHHIPCLSPLIEQHRIHEGLPVVGAQLEWLPHGVSIEAPLNPSDGSSPPSVHSAVSSEIKSSLSRFHFIGGLACMHLGPDAFNLMGARSASRNIFLLIREYVQMTRKNQSSLPGTNHMTTSPMCVPGDSAVAVSMDRGDSVLVHPPRCTPSSRRNQFTRGAKCLECQLIREQDHATSKAYRGSLNPFQILDEE